MSDPLRVKNFATGELASPEDIERYARMISNPNFYGLNPHEFFHSDLSEVSEDPTEVLERTVSVAGSSLDTSAASLEGSFRSDRTYSSHLETDTDSGDAGDEGNFDGYRSDSSDLNDEYLNDPDRYLEEEDPRGEFSEFSDDNLSQPSTVRHCSPSNESPKSMSEDLASHQESSENMSIIEKVTTTATNTITSFLNKISPSPIRFGKAHRFSPSPVSSGIVTPASSRSSESEEPSLAPLLPSLESVIPSGNFVVSPSRSGPSSPRDRSSTNSSASSCLSPVTSPLRVSSRNPSPTSSQPSSPRPVSISSKRVTSTNKFLKIYAKKEKETDEAEDDARKNARKKVLKGNVDGNVVLKIVHEVLEEYHDNQGLCSDYEYTKEGRILPRKYFAKNNLQTRIKRIYWADGLIDAMPAIEMEKVAKRIDEVAKNEQGTSVDNSIDGMDRSFIFTFYTVKIKFQCTLLLKEKDLNKRKTLLDELKILIRARDFLPMIRNFRRVYINISYPPIGSPRAVSIQGSNLSDNEFIWSRLNEVIEDEDMNLYGEMVETIRNEVLEVVESNQEDILSLFLDSTLYFLSSCCYNRPQLIGNMEEDVVDYSLREAVEKGSKKMTEMIVSKRLGRLDKKNIYIDLLVSLLNVFDATKGEDGEILEESLNTFREKLSSEMMDYLFNHVLWRGEELVTLYSYAKLLKKNIIDEQKEGWGEYQEILEMFFQRAETIIQEDFSLEYLSSLSSNEESSSIQEGDNPSDSSYPGERSETDEMAREASQKLHGEYASDSSNHSDKV